MAPGRLWILYTCSAVCALIMLDTNVVAVSLPSIARSLNASFVDVEWVVSAYMLAFASCLLPAGAIADKLGRKRVMLAGLALFALASLGCAVAWTPALLNWARAVKGIGAALLLTSALAVLGHAFQHEKERLHAWSVWGACMGAAMTLAPLLGGLITSAINWRWIFYLNLPVVALLMLLVRRHLPESKSDHGASFDPAGALLFCGALACIIWALIDATAAGWSSRATLLRFGAGALLLGAFIAAEWVQRAPMIDLQLFASRRFVGAIIGMFGYATSAQVLMTFLPLYLQNALALSPVMAGCAMLPYALAMVLCSRLTPVAGRWFGDRGVLVLGLAIVAAGNLSSALAAGALAYPLVALGMTITGAGAGLLNGTTQKAILGCVARERSGMASGISTTARFVGIVLAVAGLGALLATRTAASFTRSLALAEQGRGQGPWQGLAASPELIGRIVAGNAGAVFDHLPAPLRQAAARAAHHAFIDGFTSVLYLAALLAVVAGALVWWLMKPVPAPESAMFCSETPAACTVAPRRAARR